jgi:hypothetical protein
LRLTRRQLLQAGAAGAVALTLPNSVFALEPEVPNLTGLWLGTAQSEGGSISASHIEVIAQSHRRFESIFEMIPCIFEGRGTLSASGHLVIVGRNQDGMGIVRLQHHDFGGGAGILWEGRADITMADGTREIASPLLIKGFDPQPDPPASIVGVWRGSYTSDSGGGTGAFGVQFGTRDRAGLIPSAVEIIPCIFPNGLATIGPAGQVLVIGQGDEGQAVLVGTLDPNAIIPCIRGTYRFQLLSGLTDAGQFDMELSVT